MMAITLFAALAMLGGSAGFAVGAVASAAAEHRHDGAALHPEGVQGESDALIGGTDPD